LLLLAVGVALTAAAPAKAASNRSTQYERPDAKTIKDHAQQILSDPQFAPHMTLRQWLAEKLKRWNRINIHLPRGIATFLFWAVTVWCVLTLLAIFAHFVWTIGMLAGRPKNQGAAAGRDGSKVYERMSFEQLWDRSRELAQRGSYRDAAGVLLQALLRRLEASRVLRFHASKTNGEYLREYPGQTPGRPQFAQFVAAFERSVYGGLEIPRQTYETMNSLAERIVSDVVPKP
jgi:hypothetical protein